MILLILPCLAAPFLLCLATPFLTAPGCFYLAFSLFIPAITATHQHNYSQRTSSPLVDLIVSQANDAASCFTNQIQQCSEPYATQ